MIVKLKIPVFIILVIFGALYMQSFKAYPEFALQVDNEMPLKLSDYNIFKGNISDLVPANGFEVYELSTGLFTDYAEKQRLIKVPEGTNLKASGDDLPDFPDGTILVKTFYYSNDRQAPEKRKRIIETRILIKINSVWNAGVYKWNDEQSDAFLMTKGTDTPVNFTDSKGQGRQINYHIPGVKECAKCHSSDNEIIPIGPKIRNLNKDVLRNNVIVNQLDYLNKKEILQSQPSLVYTKLPDWRDKAIPIEKRARAYMDVNCAHCHNDGGYYSFTNLRLSYDTPFEKTKIAGKTERIDKLISKKKMPYIGTTIIDEEGLSVVKEYLNSLK